MVKFLKESIMLKWDFQRVWEGVWRHNGLMVSALSKDRAVRVGALARDILLYSWAKHVTFTVVLSIQVYKWAPANLMLRVTL